MGGLGDGGGSGGSGCAAAAVAGICAGTKAEIRDGDVAYTQRTDLVFVVCHHVLDVREIRVQGSEIWERQVASFARSRLCLHDSEVNCSDGRESDCARL